MVPSEGLGILCARLTACSEGVITWTELKSSVSHGYPLPWWKQLKSTHQPQTPHTAQLSPLPTPAPSGNRCLSSVHIFEYGFRSHKAVRCFSFHLPCFACLVASRLRCSKWQISFFLGAARCSTVCLCPLLYSPAVRGQWLFPYLGCCEQDGSTHWSEQCWGNFLWEDVWKDPIMSLETFVLFFVCLFIQDLHQSTRTPTLHNHSLYPTLSKIIIWVFIVLFWYNIKNSLPGPMSMFFSVLHWMGSTVSVLIAGSYVNLKNGQERPLAQIIMDKLINASFYFYV